MTPVTRIAIRFRAQIIGRGQMGLLRKLGQIILTRIAILGFLIFAPVLYLVIPFILLAGNANRSDLDGVAFVYMAAGPFVSAFWTMIICMLRRYRRVTSYGRPYERSLGGVFAAFGWMLFGFFGSLVAEVIFYVLFHGVSKNPFVFFALAPLATFAPLLLVWALGKKNNHRSVDNEEHTPFSGLGAKLPKRAETIEEVTAPAAKLPLKPLEEVDSDLERGWELGKRWALMRDELLSKFEAETSVFYQQLVDFDRLIEDLTPLLEEYGTAYEKRLNWNYQAEEGTLLEQVKNSWSLILLSTVHCKKCGKVVTGEAKGVNTKYGNGIMQDGATAVLNKGLCNACNESKALGAGAGS